MGESAAAISTINLYKKGNFAEIHTKEKHIE